MQRSAGCRIKRGANKNHCKVPIRTVYFAPIKLSMDNKVKEYFEKFGVVEEVRLHKKYGHEYGFVQFKTTEAAKTVLSTRSHRIENWTFKVKAADPWHQPNPLLTPPDQESPSNILIALNEDCLHEVFRKLDVKDLTNAAEVCVRFNSQTKETFARKKMKVDLRRCKKCKNCENFTNCVEWKPSELEILFSNFGGSITSLKADAKMFGSAETFVCLTNEHCTSELKVLHLENFEIIGTIAEKLRPLFASIEELDLSGCKLERNMKNLIGECIDLKKLEIFSCDGNDERIDQKFPKLEVAKISCNRFYLNFDMIDSFIKLNPTLQKLEIVDKGVDTTEIVPMIVERLPNLTELFISSLGSPWIGSVDNLLALSRLHFLEELGLHFDSMLIVPLMESLCANNVPIERLKLLYGEINDYVIGSISKMKKIKSLCIVLTSLTDENLIRLGKKLPQIQMMELYHIDTTTDGLKKMLQYSNKLTCLSLSHMEITIDVDDYMAILKMVQNRPEKLKLLIDLRFKGGYVKVPKHLLERNRDIFYIEY